MAIRMAQHEMIISWEIISKVDACIRLLQNGQVLMVEHTFCS